MTMSAKGGEREESSDNKLKKRLRRVCRTRPHLIIIFIVSIVGFCYHFHLALRQYWQYKTTVSFALETPENYQFRYPALTLCFQEVVPHFRLKEEFPEYSEAVEEIRNESQRRKDPNFWTSAESAKANRFKMRGKYLFKLFEDKVLSNVSIIKILEEWSFGREDECLLDAKPVVKTGYKMNDCSHVRSEPLESINGDFRCFTYLSQLDHVIEDKQLFTTSLFLSQSNFEQRTNKVYYVAHALNTSLAPHPFETEFRARVLVHAPEAVPVPKFYPSLPLYQWSRFYDIQFWKTVSHLLEAPYETQCQQYTTGPNETLQSWDDCFGKCLANQYRRACNCLPRSGILFRRALLTPDDKFCGKVNKCQFTNYRLECERVCKHSCLTEEYSFATFADIPFYAHNNLTGIQLSRKPTHDHVYRHAPAVTFIQLVCDFGGLGGLWLGFSVITITTALIQLITRPLERSLDK